MVDQLISIVDCKGEGQRIVDQRRVDIEVKVSESRIGLSYIQQQDSVVDVCRG